MYYKQDWEQARKRLEAFWNNKMIDRCCVAVFAPRKTSKLPPFPELQWGPWLGGLDALADEDTEGIRKWWMDPEQNYKRMISWFENTYFGGEAIPCTYVNWGAMAMAAFYGSPAKFTKNSVWYHPVIEDWGTWEWKFETDTNEYWQHALSITRYLLDNNNGRYFVGTPEFGAAGDILTLMRGTAELCLDLFEHTEAVQKAIEVIANTWVMLNEQIYQMTYETNDRGGVLAWMSLWSPGRHSQLACDFSNMISPAMFRRYFVHEIEVEGDWCEYGTYHLDGPTAMKHMLEILLSIEQIDNIEFTPGAGSPPTYSPQYIPAYQKIQKSGKRLYLLAEPQEIEPLLKELSPKGLFLCTHANSEDEANEIIRKVTRWSEKKSVFPVLSMPISRDE